MIAGYMELKKRRVRMKLMPFLVLLVLLQSAGFAQASCWSKKEFREIENFSELDDKLILSYKDAVTCNPVNGASVQLGKLTYQTDSRGYVTLPMSLFLQAGDQDIPISISHSAFVSVDTDLRLAAGTVLNRRLLLSPKIGGNSMRFILQWNDEPEDMDLHLIGDDLHITYRDMKQSGQASLDQDAQHGWGPETITLKNIQGDKNYLLRVVNYSGEKKIDEQAKVLVYSGDQLLMVVPVGSSSADSVDVLEIKQAKVTALHSVSGAAPLPGW
jgi:hypothetical protein